MSLNWNLPHQDDDDYSEFYDEFPSGRKALKAEPDALIWLTMTIGLHEISEKNWKEFYRRVRLSERVYGHYISLDGKPYYFKPADIKKYIGISTNASRLTKTAFENKIKRALIDDTNKLVEYAIKQM